MLSINDEQLCEGFLGGLGWVLFFFHFRNRVQYNLAVEGFLAWMFVWWFRKFGMNLYKNYKLKKGLKTKFLTII